MHENYDATNGHQQNSPESTSSLAGSQMLNKHVDAPLLARSVRHDVLQLPSVGRQHLPLLLRRDGPNCSGNAVPVERSVRLVPRCLQPDLPPLHEPRVGALVAEDGQHDQRVPELEPLDDGTPPAVRQERADGAVRQHSDLRNPPRRHEPTVAGALHEPVGYDAVFLDADRRPQGPEEARPGELQAVGKLAEQLDTQRRLGSQRDVHDRLGGLRVEPPHGRVVVLRAPADAARSVGLRRQHAERDGRLAVEPRQERERFRLQLGTAPSGEEPGPRQRLDEAADDGRPRVAHGGEKLRGLLLLERWCRAHGLVDRLPLLRVRVHRRRRAGGARDACGARDEHGAWNVAVLGSSGDPVVDKIGDDPVGPPPGSTIHRRARGVEERRERRGEAVEGLPVELELVVWHVAGGLGAVREAVDARERQRDELDERRQRGRHGRESLEVARRGNERHAVTARGQTLSELEAGKQVAESEPREDDDVHGRVVGRVHCERE